MNIAMLLAGGVGKRMGANVPKQFLEVKGRPIITYPLEIMEKLEDIDAIEIVCVESFITEMWSIVEKNGFSKVTFPTTSRTDIPLPESADGTIKTTKVGASARFGEAHGMFHMDDNSGNVTARAWRMKMFYVKNKETNYVNTSSTESVPVCFHYFQQCAPALSLDHETFQCTAGVATDDVAVRCSREYEWDVE